MERASSTSSIQNLMEEEEEEGEEEYMDDQQSTITSVSLPQQLHYHVNNKYRFDYINNPTKQKIYFYL
jgi:hypothetical protein